MIAKNWTRWTTLLLISTLTISGCSLIPNKKVEIVSKPLEIDIIQPTMPRNIDLKEPKFYVVSEAKIANPCVKNKETGKSQRKPPTSVLKPPRIENPGHGTSPAPAAPGCRTRCRNGAPTRVAFQPPINVHNLKFKNCFNFNVFIPPAEGKAGQTNLVKVLKHWFEETLQQQMEGICHCLP